MGEDEMKRLLDAMQQETLDAHAETRRHFDVAVERMEKRFDLLAESVAGVTVELRETRTALDQKIEHSALETQSMIKFSHRELDRRVTSLEDAVNDLQARVDRLEDSAQ